MQERQKMFFLIGIYLVLKFAKNWVVMVKIAWFVSYSQICV